MNDLRTNRDLYLAIKALSKTQSGCSRSLADYLLTLLDSSYQFSNCDSLTLSEFYDLVSAAFVRDIPAFNHAWCEQYDGLPCENDDYVGWKSTLIRQIVDLREMDQDGILKNDQRYFGVSSPRKSYWYNFDPLGYLECAMAGSFGGWEPGDDTGRQFVPGPVAVIGDDGSIQSANSEDLDRPIVKMPTIKWDQFKDFIMCGQMYE